MPHFRTRLHQLLVDWLLVFLDLIALAKRSLRLLVFVDLVDVPKRLDQAGRVRAHLHLVRHEDVLGEL